MASDKEGSLSRLTTEIDMKRLADILEEGRFLNQFATQTSGGLFDPTRRVQCEYAHFGLARDATASERPIYGYFHSSPNGQLAPDGPLDSMGALVSVRLSDRLRQRASLTGGDSFDETRAGLSATLAARPVEKPTWEAFSSKLGDLLRYDTLESLVRAAESDNEVGYIEAQFFGGVELADITQVLFYDEEIPDTIRLLLEKRRLPWHMVK